MITGGCDRTSVDPTTTRTLGVSIRARPSVQADAAEPGIARTEPDRLLRADVAEPGIVRTEPDRLLRRMLPSPASQGSSPTVCSGQMCRARHREVEPGSIETVGDTRLRHLTCLSDDAFDCFDDGPVAGNIDRNANDKNMNSCPPLRSVAATARVLWREVSNVGHRAGASRRRKRTACRSGSGGSGFPSEWTHRPSRRSMSRLSRSISAASSSALSRNRRPVRIS